MSAVSATTLLELRNTKVVVEQSRGEGVDVSAVNKAVLKVVVSNQAALEVVISN